MTVYCRASHQGAAWTAEPELLPELSLYRHLQKARRTGDFLKINNLGQNQGNSKRKQVVRLRNKRCNRIDGQLSEEATTYLIFGNVSAISPVKKS